MSDSTITQFGRYKIIAELGRGAMGVVYKAEDPILSRQVAIKTILMSTDVEERAEYEARFYQEAKAAGGLNHPAIITIHDIGKEGDIHYMAMEFLEGVDLRELMKGGQLPLSKALDIMAQVADGLAFAHEHGVVHRDIKPANIMIVRDQHAKIMDFGIARIRLSDVKTQAGALLGSPKYMSPEQVAGLRADHRSDIFSLGVVCYELVAGVPPFMAPEVGQLMYQVSTAKAPPPTSINASLPTMIDLIVAKALEKDPEARYQSASELLADLRACRAEIPEQQTPAASSAEKIAGAEAGIEKTVVLSGETNKTQVISDVTQTLKHPAGTADTGMRLSVSPRFDSADAIQRFKERSATEGVKEAEMVDESGTRLLTGSGETDRLRMTFFRRFHEPEQRTFAIAMLLAVVVAVIVALI